MIRTSQAAAQQTAAPAQTPFAPPIPGLCTFAREAAMAGSRAGQGADRRLRELGAGITAELAPEQAAITRENTALIAGTVPPADRAARLAALQTRAAAFGRLQQTRGAQLQATRTQAAEALAAAIDPLLTGLVQQRRCALILERGTTYGANPAMDLTPALVAQLDQRLPAITVTLAPPPR